MSLRERALRGGAYLTAREILGLILRLVGVVLVTRLIGPSDFGLYAGSLAVVTVLATAAQLGSEVFLVRREHEPERALYDQVFTMLLLSTAVAIAVGLAGSLLVGWFVADAGFLVPLQVLLLAVPLGVLWAPAQAKLERNFRFRAMAMLQLGSDFLLYAVAVALAFAGAGVWAPIAGTFAAYAWLLVLGYVLAGHRPRWNLSRELASELGRYGLSFTPAGLLGRAEQLVNPLVVGSFLGAASVGYVALAVRFVETASFVLRATYRVSLVALGRVQSDVARLRRGFEEMLTLQVLTLGPILVGIAVASPWVVPALFGEEWRPTLRVYPFIAAGALLLAVFNVHYTLLYVKGRNLTMGAIALTRLAILSVAALALVPPLGIEGFGVAVALASAAWVIAHREVRKLLDFDYGMALRWAAAFLPPLFIPFFDLPWGLTLLASLLLVAGDRRARRQLRDYAGFVRTMVAGRGAAPVDE